MAKTSLPIIDDPPPPAPKCRGCGKTLSPVFFPISEARMARVLSSIPAPHTCHPDDTGLIGKGYNVAEIDPETGQFVLRNYHTAFTGRRWSGYFGYDHNSLFCSLRCGYSFGVRTAKGGG